MIAWPAILEDAADIVRRYDTGVTLRQLFYRLVAAGLLPNVLQAYKGLSDRTTRAREAGEFPDLLDRTRRIHRHPHFADVTDALVWLREIYRRDRTEGQAHSVYIGVEKAGLVEQLQAWFGNFGIPMLALGGYASHTYKRMVLADVSAHRRPAVLLYGGDFDPSGEDIDRDFIAKTGCWSRVVRVALRREQVEEHDLPPAYGKTTDSRASGFVARHGRLVQVELDALPPDVLQRLFAGALAAYWDQEAHQAVLATEADERAVLDEIAHGRQR